MDFNLFEKISKIAATIGEKFNLIFLAILSDVDFHDIISILNSEYGKKRFEKVDQFNYKFIRKEDREKILKELGNEEKEDIFKKHKESLIKTVFEELNYLYLQENKKLLKEDIIKIFIDFIDYLIEDGRTSIANKYLDFMIINAYKNSESFEKALLLKSKIEFRNKNYEEVLRYLNQISIFPEYLIKKYDLLCELYFETGNDVELEKAKNEWIKILEVEKIYNESVYNHAVVEYLLRKSKYDEAIKILKEKENEIMDKFNIYNYPIISKLIGDISNVIGYYFYEKDNFKEALKYYLKSVEYYKKHNFEREILIPYNNIAEIYKAYKKYDKALNIYKNIYQTSKTLGEKEIHSVSLWNIGEIYFYMNNFEEAYKYFSEAEKLFFEAGVYSKYENYIKVFFAKLYFEMNNIELAKEYADEVLISAYEKKQLKEYADALVIKGKIVAKNKEDPISFFNEANEIYKQLGLEQDIKEVEKLKIVYKKL